MVWLFLKCSNLKTEYGFYKMIEKRHLKKVYSNLEHYFCPLYSESSKVSWKQASLPSRQMAPTKLSPKTSPKKSAPGKLPPKAVGLQPYLKRGSGTGVFLWILRDRCFWHDSVIKKCSQKIRNIWIIFYFACRNCESDEIKSVK